MKMKREDEKSHNDNWRTLPMQQMLLLACAIVGFLNVVTMAAFYAQGRPFMFQTQNCLPSSRDPTSLLYSPVNHLLTYHVEKFPQDLKGGEFSKYHGHPTPEKDELWADLYRFGAHMVGKEETSLLPNQTSAIPGQDENYMVYFDVFHQLHCLGLIRKRLYPDYYNSTKGGHETHFGHIEHCIDQLRASLVCHTDVSVIVWQNTPETGGLEPRADVLHTCRNFDAVRQWAIDHKAKYVEGHLPRSTIFG
ncbi:hypothetical protein NQ176_g4257 [Zarea fungicola]|uniref:Uncharacterized protein n=1 Tax=Zarea fungicola TaxID=93591 RepID=A0ACC1NF23_9HYPO|nr:hypothetical protein NQ176_g4257 [Lecanicillium fungicola]